MHEVMRSQSRGWNEVLRVSRLNNLEAVNLPMNTGTAGLIPKDSMRVNDREEMALRLLSHGCDVRFL